MRGHVVYRTCYDCGARVPSTYLLCPECASGHITAGRGRPRVVVDESADAIELPYPWSALGLWPDQTVIALVGPPGSGKSTLAAQIQPDVWITTEQTIRRAAQLMERVGADPEIVEIHGVRPAEPGPDDEPDADRARFDTRVSKPGRRETLAEAIEGHSGVVVVDSVTELGHHDRALEATRLLREWVDAQGDRRAVVIVGVNAAGQAAGRKQLIHLVDQFVFIEPHDDGSRSFNIQKNRSGPEDNVYFRIDERGIRRPSFPYAYSVEGAPGAYQLVPYPTRGAKWQGVIERYQQTMLRGEPGDLSGLAGAGQFVPGYPDNTLQPADVDARRRFAELHGLTWINPEQPGEE